MPRIEMESHVRIGNKIETRRVIVDLPNKLFVPKIGRYLFGDECVRGYTAPDTNTIIYAEDYVNEQINKPKTAKPIEIKLHDENEQTL